MLYSLSGEKITIAKVLIHIGWEPDEQEKKTMLQSLVKEGKIFAFILSGNY